jgi:hypothetical protein
MCFFNSAEYTFLEQIEPISTLKHPSGSLDSLQKLTQYLQGNNVPDVTASNTDGFLSRDK